MKKILNLIAFVAVTQFTVSTHAAKAPRPNIVFVLVDDLRWDALGCTGHPFVKTPNIDRIAKEGALFKNFFVTLPLCSPSRASFLTGQYAHRNGIIDNSNHNELSHKLVTFPKLLHDVGYETAYVGKLHMGNDDSPRPGFDRWVSFKGQGNYTDPMINVDGTASRMTGYMTDILNSHAVDFVKKEHTKPFVLYLAHKAVHGPFTPAERHKDLYADVKISPPPSIDDSLEGKPALTREAGAAPGKKQKNANANVEAEKKFPPGAMLQQLLALAAIDEGVGQIFDALEENRQLDSTIFIFSSDNGFFWGEHGLGDKRWAYEESIRDPLLVRYPKYAKSGTVIDKIVLNIDLAPTLLELGGVKIPKTIQGKSFLPLLKGERTRWRESALLEYFSEKQYRTPTWQAVRTDRWKYIQYPGIAGADELYDLMEDPYEMKNLVKESSAQKQLKEMRKELGKLMRQY
ncbi:MAG: sulfatase [Verrucomicrobiota bacterium]